MSRPDLHTFVQNLTQQLSAAGTSGLGDAQLLERWLGRRDQAAFELLLRRHGPLVLSVCRRMLRDPRDVEDAFQATFLILLRKAPRLRNLRALPGWLHRVAYRVCLRALKDRRRGAGPILDEVADRPASDELLWRDLRPVLDEEINALPERYRAAFVLCNLQGKTNQEAADALGCPLGTILSRLHWARDRLRRRLTRRGIAVSAAVLAGTAPAGEVPPAMLERSLTMAVEYPATLPPAPVWDLSKGVLQAMLMTKVKWMAFLAVVVLLLTYSAWNGSERLEAAPAPPAKPPAAPPANSDEPPPPPRNWVLVPARVAGTLAFVGREPRPGEKVEPDRTFMVEVEGRLTTRIRLREGDRVKQGEQLALVEERLARAEVALRMGKVEAAEGELRASEATSQEARLRYERGMALFKRGAIAMEEVDGFRLTHQRYVEEVKAKQAGLQIARIELDLAKAQREMHEIRSPVTGVIQAIHKHNGEAVRQFDSVFRIKFDEK